MFAKLKKKIQDEGGPEKERTFGPGLASPIKRESMGSGLFGPARKESNVRDGRESDTASVSSQESVSCSTKEQVLAMLMKRTDQVKKMEAKITDLAALIKDRNRTVEKLESALEKQQDSTSQRLNDLMVQHEEEKRKLNETLMEEVAKKEETQLELVDCQSQLQSHTSVKDEKRTQVVQEVARLKHLLSSTKSEVNKLQEKCDSQEQELDTSQKRVKELENQMKSLTEKFNNLQRKSSSAEGELKEHMKHVEELAAQKATLTKKAEDLQTQLSQKSSQLVATEKDLAEIQDQHMTLQRNSDLHRQKLNSMLSEKDDSIMHLQERIVTLDQRVQDSGLSEDDRLKAIETERSTLEKKLDETRQQLTEVKTTWSDKITHLESQIAHLNNKIVEDNDELASGRNELKEAHLKFEQQLYEMQLKLQASQKQATVNFEMAHEKDKLMDKQKEAMELELMSVRTKCSDLEADLKVKDEQTQKQVARLQRTLEEEKKNAKRKINELESNQDEWLEKEIDNEKQITKMEDDFLKAKAELQHRNKDVSRLTNDLNEKTKHLKNVQQQMSSLQDQLKDVSSDKENQRRTQTGLQADVLMYKQEIESLVKKNKELNKEIASTNNKSHETEGNLRKDLLSRETAISGLEQCLQDMQREIGELNTKVSILEDEKVRAKNELESAEVERLRTELTGLETQLTDRNKTIKMQQQRLSDLKKTLQREFKVQSLPNDEAVENNHTMDPVREEDVPPHLALFKQSKPNRDSWSRMSRAASLTSLNNSRTLEKFSSVPGNKNSRGLPGKGLDELDDVNFEYLKHVVLKFMLSRESEALLLIKAISTLLRLSPDEEQVVQETLEWKMSWFSSRRPALGRGQTAKIIPPSY